MLARIPKGLDGHLVGIVEVTDIAVESNSKEPLIQQWKTVVDAQMHFNDMILRTRALGITVVIGVYGAAAALANRPPQLTVEITGRHPNASSLIICLGLALLVSVFLLDYCYYYKLLLGAVERGEQLERELSSQGATQPRETFKLTLQLSTCVSRKRARNLIFAFYVIPFVSGIIFFWAI